MTNMDEEDRKYFDKHFGSLYKGQKDTDEQVATNTTDIGWLKWGQRILLGGLVALGLAAAGLAAGGLN